MKLKSVLILSLVAFILSSCGGTKQPDVKQPETSNETSVLDVIMNRRSVRSYKPEQIKDEELNKILECGINAPSAMNRQSWEIRVIQNPEILKNIKNAYYSAPTLIVIASETANSYSPVDCGLLGQNILLAAEHMNIGTCVIGSLNDFWNTDGVEVVQSLGLSEGYAPLYCIAMGYKNETPEAKPRDNGKIKFLK